MNLTKEAAVILVVDDEASVCCCLTDALRSEGYNAIGASNLEQALQLAQQYHPDLVVTDLRLEESTGLDVVSALRRQHGSDLPAVIITGHRDLAALSAASRLRPVEVIDKPVDIQRLTATVRSELHRLRRTRQTQKRLDRVRQLARKAKRSGKRDATILTTACADLTSTCQSLQDRLERQESVLHYQAELLGCNNEDDIFRRLFKLFVDRGGAVFGVALLCDSAAELQMVGRFGVPQPDGTNFSNALAMAMVPPVLQRPEVQVVDCMDHISLFPDVLHRKLIGVTAMAVPLMASEGQMIGLVVLYRKGEQPFTDEDIAMANLIGPSTAAAAMRT
jgi:DNA-binding response OmpR family regulator